MLKSHQELKQQEFFSRGKVSQNVISFMNEVNEIMTTFEKTRPEMQKSTYSN